MVQLCSRKTPADGIHYIQSAINTSVSREKYVAVGQCIKAALQEHHTQKNTQKGQFIIIWKTPT